MGSGERRLRERDRQGGQGGNVERRGHPTVEDELLAAGSRRRRQQPAEAEEEKQDEVQVQRHGCASGSGTDAAEPWSLDVVRAPGGLFILVNAGGRRMRL